MANTAVTPADLDALRAGDDVAVIDVREPPGYAEGHVPGSTLVPRRVLERRLPELVPNPETTVVLVDAAGERTERDAAWLGRLGYANARHLAGGTAAWEAAGRDVEAMSAGVYSTAFNVPSKRFGEEVEVERDPPRVTPEQLAAWREAGEDVLLVDVRTPGEHREATIPGAINVEGVDAPAYVEALREEGQTVVVHCAGRTRSILNSATLQRRGLSDVYGLEDGTSGWTLAGFDLERGSDRHVREVEMDEGEAGSARAFAEDLLAERERIERLSPAEFEARRDAGGTVYPFDVRTVPEFESGHVPGTLGVPGGQAIQRADDYVAVRTGLVVCISETFVRAAITAYWYAEMGFPNVAVLDGGVEAWTESGRELETGCGRAELLGLHRAVEQSHSCRDPAGWPAVADGVVSRSPEWVDETDPLVLDVGRSERYREGHVPGSRWVSRTALDDVVAEAADPVVLASPGGVLATYAAASLAHAGHGDVAALAGGVNGWREAGLPVETGEGTIEGRAADTVPSTTDQGEEGMRGYLSWERDLPGNGG